MNSAHKKKLCFVFGTRPEVIKMAPIILAAQKRPEFETLVCSTGQHRDMLSALYQLFEFQPDIDFQLMKPQQSLAEFHANATLHMQKLFSERTPDWVIAQGDTTTAHAAALTAFYQKIQVAHVEAGLRTYDIESPYPEEFNRRAIALTAQVHFSPTQDAADNLKGELLSLKSTTLVTGNTGIDGLYLVSKKLEENAELKKRAMQSFLNLKNKKFILCTFHRRENFGDGHRQVLKALVRLVQKHPVDIVLPCHPNPQVRNVIQEILQPAHNKFVMSTLQNDTFVKAHDREEATEPGRIWLTDPLDYLQLVAVLKESAFVMTDSGGLQEEAPTFGKKILVLRDRTERPEGVEAGFSKLVGTDQELIFNEAENLILNENHWSERGGQAPANPYGDGHASDRILDFLANH